MSHERVQEATGTLGELGFDSLMSSELQHKLETEYHLTFKSGKELTDLTVESLANISKGKIIALIVIFDCKDDCPKY